jgi:hypothetical protein
MIQEHSNSAMTTRNGNTNGHWDGTRNGGFHEGSIRPLIYLPDGRVIEVGGGDPLKSESSESGRRARRTSEFGKSWLDEKTRVEIIEDSSCPSRLLFAVRREGRIDIVNRLELKDSELTPPSKCAEPFKSMNLPSGVSPYDSPEELATKCGEFIREIVPISAAEEEILSAFVLHSWIWDRLPFAVCPVLFGPADITEFVIEALALICRRSVIVGTASASGILEACSRYDLTLLISRDSLNNSALEALDMGSQARCLHLRGHGITTAFGPKLIAASEGRAELDQLRGGFGLFLSASEFPRWSRLYDREVRTQAEQLRCQLLQFRFDHVDSVEIPKGAWSFQYPKRAVITEALVAPFGASPDYGKELATDLAEIDFDRAEGLPVNKRIVLSASFHLIHDEKLRIEGEMTVGQITELANNCFQERGDNLRLTPRKVGAILTGLGMSHHSRSRYGYFVSVDSETIQLFHKLARLYGVSSPEPYTYWEPTVYCKWCRNLKLVNDAAIRDFERRMKENETSKEKAVQAHAQRRFVSHYKSPPLGEIRLRKTAGGSESEKPTANKSGESDYNKKKPAHRGGATPCGG